MGTMWSARAEMSTFPGSASRRRSSRPLTRSTSLPESSMPRVPAKSGGRFADSPHPAAPDANQGPPKGPLTCTFTVGDSRFELLTPSVSILQRPGRRVPRGAKPLQNQGFWRRLSPAGTPRHSHLMDNVMDSPRRHRHKRSEALRRLRAPIDTHGSVGLHEPSLRNREGAG
jgi:hypothetical protein